MNNLPSEGGNPMIMIHSRLGMPVEQPLPSGAAPDSGLLPVVSQLATGSTWSGPARPGRPRRQMGPVTGHGAVTGTSRQNGGTGPKNGLNHDPCGNLEDGAERWVGKHPIECEPSIPHDGSGPSILWGNEKPCKAQN